MNEKLKTSIFPIQKCICYNIFFCQNFHFLQCSMYSNNLRIVRIKFVEWMNSILYFEMWSKTKKEKKNRGYELFKRLTAHASLPWSFLSPKSETECNWDSWFVHRRLRCQQLDCCTFSRGNKIDARPEKFMYYFKRDYDSIQFVKVVLRIWNYTCYSICYQCFVYRL